MTKSLTDRPHSITPHLIVLCWISIIGILFSAICAAQEPSNTHKRTTAEVRTVDGIPELFVNGERMSRMWGRLALPGEEAPDKLTQYQDAGIDVYITAIDKASSLGWDGEDGYDYTPYEWHLRRIIAEKPDIKLILYVGCVGGSPYKWNKAHEDQLALLDNGDRLRFPSLASEQWLEDSSEAFRRFALHFEQSEFADNIIGYNPIMYANEWLTLAWRKTDHLDDYSEPMVHRFRQWLHEWYDGDESRLRQSWKDPQVTFATAAIPSAEQRKAVNPNLLLNTYAPSGNQVSDYNRCYWETNAQAAIRACRAIKEAAPGKLTFMMHGNKPAAQLLLESEWVDGVHGPYSYGNRKRAHFSWFPMDSFHQHNKLFIDQTDTGTHLMPRWGGYQLGTGSLWTPPRLADNLWESLEILERDIAYSLTKNCHSYWNEGGPGWMFPIFPHGVTTWGKFWFDDPDIKSLITDLKGLVDDNQEEAGRSTSQVACVFSQDLWHYLPTELPYEYLFGRRGFKQLVMARAGVPFDEYLLEDFDSIEKSYKVYLFPDALYTPKAQRAEIQKKLAAEGATAVWFYGAGYLDELGTGLEGMEQLTGIRMAKEDAPGFVEIDLIQQPQPLLKDLNSAVSFGSASAIRSDLIIPFEDSAMKPEPWPQSLPVMFWADDPDAAVLGTLQRNGKPGVVVKETHGYRSVWIGAPLPPWQLIRNILTDSGVHLYSESGDLTYANSRYVSLYSVGSGTKTVYFPESVSLFDALSGERLADKTREWSFEGKAGETRTFRLEK